MKAAIKFITNELSCPAKDAEAIYSHILLGLLPKELSWEEWHDEIGDSGMGFVVRLARQNLLLANQVAELQRKISLT